MFDVGFWELVVIFVIGLLVLGPQRLPEVARQLGQWTGKARGMARILKQQLREELGDVHPRQVMKAPPAKGAPSPVASTQVTADGLNGGRSNAEAASFPPATVESNDPPADPPVA